MTSHDVVARLRRLFHQRRTGHAGTLDPSATGVLVVGFGRATRLLRFLQATTKVYEGELVLGETTTTLDADGEVTERFDMSSVTPEEVERAAVALRGDILQVPPMVSAIKVGGRRLHELARAGEEIERQPRAVRIDRFELSPTDDPCCYRFEVRCSSGTYVRSLADDLGRLLGGGAHLSRLRRSEVGSFRIDEAQRLDELTAALEQGEAPGSLLMSPAAAMRDMTALAVDEEIARLVSTGRGLDHEVGQIAGPYALVDQAGELLAVYRDAEPGRIVPVVVLAG